MKTQALGDVLGLQNVVEAQVLTTDGAEVPRIPSLNHPKSQEFERCVARVRQVMSMIYSFVRGSQDRFLRHCCWSVFSGTAVALPLVELKVRVM